MMALVKKYGHVIPILVMFPYFIYMVYQSVGVRTHQVKVQDPLSDDYSLYYVSADVSAEIEQIAASLHGVQGCLDYVTMIPYKIGKRFARNPMQTVQRNYGDCDDKSNLLSSLLTAKGVENYIVLVPKHAFVIAHLNQTLGDTKAIRFGGKAFYILESTAQGSSIGYPMEYSIAQIEAVINPRTREVVNTGKIAYY